MLTIADALNMPVFASAQVVAGKKGLNNCIQWVHMIDIPEMADWSREGELVFTTAFGLKDHPDVQRTLVPNLARRGVAGMVIGVGRYFHHIPEELIRQADELGFPIITLPWEVPFIEVTRAISEHIVHERYALMQKSLQIHNTLTRLVLTGDNLEALAKALTNLVHCPVTIEDPNFQLLTYASLEEVDQARQATIEQGRTPPNLLMELEHRGVLDQLHRSLRPVRIPPLPERGLEFERIIAPIVAGQELYGYVCILLCDREADELDMIAIEHAATVAALILLKEKAVYEAEQRLKSALLEGLLARDGDLHNRLIAQAHRFGYDLTRNQQILLLRPRRDLSLSRLSQWVQSRLLNWGTSGLIVERGRYLVLLLPSEQTRDGELLAHRLRESGAKDGYDLLIGIGRAYPGLDQILESYEEAREAIEIGPSLIGTAVVSFDNLGVLHWLPHLPPAVREKNPFNRPIQILSEYDARRHTNLLETLETYLDTGRNAKETARRLFLHRNTLRQRLAKISFLCQVNLDDPFASLNLLLAIKDIKLRQNR